MDIFILIVLIVMCIYIIIMQNKIQNLNHKINMLEIDVNHKVTMLKIDVRHNKDINNIYIDHLKFMINLILKNRRM